MRYCGWVIALFLTGSHALAQTPTVTRESVEQAQALDSPATMAIGDQAINAALVDAFMGLPSQRNQSDRQAAAQRVAELYLLAAEAQQQGLTRQPEHVAGLAIAELNYLATAVLQQVLAGVDTSEPALRALHEENLAAAGGVEYRLSWIVLEQRAQAQAVLAEVDDLESFGLAARQHSLDEATAEFGGERGWVQRPELAQPLRQVVDTLLPGAIHPEPIAWNGQWVLLMLRDRRDLTVPDFDVIRPALISQARREAVTAMVNRLREGAGLAPRQD